MPNDTPATGTPSLPKTVFWEVTNRCNLACEHCYNKPFLNDKRHTLGLAEGLSRCEALIEAGIQTVIFLGGEPLADRNLLSYIAKLREAGVACSISTNGTLITPAVAGELARLQVFLVSISLDGGTPELNDKVRGSGTFDRIVRGLAILKQHQLNGCPRITLACTLSQENSTNYEPLFQLARQVGVVDVFFNKYQKVNDSALTVTDATSFVRDMEAACLAAATVGEFYVYVPTMPRVADYLRQLTGVHVIAKEETCGAVDEAVLLSDDDKVYACSMARVARPEFGVKYRGSLADALMSDALQNFVETRRQMRCAIPSVCVGCKYLQSCATRCVLTTDQTKYYLACEVIQRRLSSPEGKP